MTPEQRSGAKVIERSDEELCRRPGNDPRPQHSRGRADTALSSTPTLSPVDPADVFMISGYVAGLSRNWKRVDNVFCVDFQLYADVADVGMEAFDPCEVKTYRWTIEERCVDGCDVPTASLEEVEWMGSKLGYVETGDTL